MGLKPFFSEDEGKRNSSNEQKLPEINNLNLEGKNLAEISDFLHTKAQESLAAVEELKGTMEQIAAAAEESAGAAEESLAAVTQIKNNSHALQESTSYILNVVENLKDVLEIAEEDINDSKLGMEKTAKSAEDIVGKGEKLFQSSKKISDAVDLITKLSRRISLLALNAAIEATRTKEKGKSFTVMASEIREMAAKSDIYASNIKEIVEKIQDKISNLKEDIESVGNRIEDSSSNSSNIADLMTELMNWMIEISETMNKILASIHKVVKEIDKLHQGAKTIAVAADKSATSTNEVSQAIGNKIEIFSKVEQLAEKIKNDPGNKNILSTIDLIISSIEEMRSSIEKIVHSLEQIEQSAFISKTDALNNATIANNCVNFMKEADNLVKFIYNQIDKIEKQFLSILEGVRNIRKVSKENAELLEKRKIEILEIKSTINDLLRMMRKIELSLVQIVALSINGSVEATKYGELGNGFSDVSKDIKKLSSQSEQHLDKVFQNINEVAEGTDSILLEVNNVILNQDRENEKLQKLEFELKRNYKLINQVKKKISSFKENVEEILAALEQSKIASDQISEAAQLSLRNATESREAAQIILNSVNDLKTISDKLAILSGEK